MLPWDIWINLLCVLTPACALMALQEKNKQLHWFGVALIWLCLLSSTLDILHCCCVLSEDDRETHEHVLMSRAGAQMGHCTWTEGIHICAEDAFVIHGLIYKKVRERLSCESAWFCDKLRRASYYQRREINADYLQWHHFSSCVRAETEAEQSFVNWKVGALIPALCRPHIKVSVGKNPLIILPAFTDIQVGLEQRSSTAQTKKKKLNRLRSAAWRWTWMSECGVKCKATLSGKQA